MHPASPALIDWLLDEIAFAPAHSISVTRLVQLVNIYHETREPDLPVHYQVTIAAWEAILSHQDVVVHDRAAAARPLHELETLPEAADAGPAQPRIEVTEARCWQAIAGHPKDLARLPKFEWQCLTFIAAAGPAGIVQPELVKKTGQDKRSVPRRTDFLAQKGHVEKRSVIASKQKTSLLTHRKFCDPAAEQPAHPQAYTEIHPADLPADVLVKDLEPVPGHERWTGDVLDNESLARTLIAVVRAWGVIKQKDVQKKLHVAHLRWQRKTLSKATRMLIAAGVLKVTDAKLPGQPAKIMKHCLKLVREPDDADWGLFQKRPTSINHHQKTRRNKKRRKALERRLAAARADPDDLSYLDLELEPAADPDQELKSERVTDITPESGVAESGRCWHPDVPLENSVLEVVRQAGTAGIQASDIACRLGAANDPRMLTLIRSFAKESEQPLYLQPTTIISHGPGPKIYYTHEIFQRLVDAGELSWSGHEEPQPVDAFGFPALHADLFHDENFDATLLDAISGLIGQRADGKKTTRKKAAPPKLPADPPRRRGRPPGSKKKVDVQEVEKPVAETGEKPAEQVAETPQITPPFLNQLPDTGRATRRSIFTGVREAVYTSYEEMQWTAGAAGVYVNPPGSARRRTGHIGRPPKSLVVVFRSPTIKSLTPRPKDETTVQSLKRKAVEAPDHTQPTKRHAEYKSPYALEPAQQVPYSAPSRQEPYESPYSQLPLDVPFDESADPEMIPISDEALQERIQPARDADLPTHSARLSVYFRGMLGNLCLGKDRTTKEMALEFYECQESGAVLKFAAAVHELVQYPDTLKDAPRLRLRSGQVCIFQFANTAADRQDANNLRTRVITAMLPLQNRRGGRTAAAAADKPYRCETCDNAWKNEGGLLYHQTKSRSLCNPNFDPGIPWGKSQAVTQNASPRTGDRAAEQDTDHLVELGPRGQVLLQVDQPAEGLLALPAPVAQPTPSPPALVPASPSPVSAPVSARYTSQQGHQSRPDSQLAPIPRQSSAQQSSLPTLPASTPRPIRQEKPDEATDHRRDDLPLKELRGDSPATSVKRKRPAAPRVVIDSSSEFSEEEPPAKVQGVTLQDLKRKNVLNRQWRKDVLMELIEANDGVFPCDRGIWFAMARLWNEQHPNVLIPDYRTCKSTVALLEDAKKVKKIEFSYGSGRTRPKLRSLVMLYDIDVMDPRVLTLKENIKADGTEYYTPPGFEPPDYVIRKIEPTFGNLPPGTPCDLDDGPAIEVLSAPFYARIVEKTKPPPKIGRPARLPKLKRNNRSLASKTVKPPVRRPDKRQEKQQSSNVEFYFSESEGDEPAYMGYNPTWHATPWTETLIPGWNVSPAVKAARHHPRLPEPTTLMQTLKNPCWSFRPFGHGVRPIHARLARRDFHGEVIDVRVNNRHRPVLLPKPHAVLPPTVTEDLHFQGQSWKVAFNSTPPPPPAPFMSRWSTWNAPYPFVNPPVQIPIKKTVRARQKPVEDSIEWRPVEKTLVSAKFFAPNTALDETSTDGPTKFPSIGWDSDSDSDVDLEMPQELSAVDISFVEPKMIRKGDWSMRETNMSTSFTVEGLPSHSRRLLDRLPSDLDGILRESSDAFDESKFIADVESVAAWELNDGMADLLSGSVTSHVFINHSIDYPPKVLMGRQNLIWTDGTLFTVYNFPWAEMDKEEHRIYGSAGRDERPSERSIAAKDRRNLLGAYKTRRVTSLPADLKDFDVKQSQADAVEVDFKYNDGSERRKRTNTGALSPSDEDRVLVAVVVIRTLTGGLDKVIDWVLVSRLFPQFTVSFIQRRWAPLFQKYKVKIGKLTTDFQDAFFDAYESGVLPPLDYDHLLDYDWERIVNWAMDLVNLGNKKNWPRLPASRQRLEQQCRILEPASARDNWRDAYFSGSTAVHKRLDTSSSQNLTVALQPLPDTWDASLILAKSIVRASVLTPLEAWSKETADGKMSPLGNDLARHAVEVLKEEKVIMHKNRNRWVPGRGYDMTDAFHAGLRKHVDEKLLQQAAAFKSTLDERLRREETVSVDYAADDGSILALTNMQSCQQVKLEMRNVPNNKFGLTDGGYQTKTMDKKRLRFEMVVVPTADYLYNDRHDVLQRFRGAPPPRDDFGRYPVWYDINDAVILPLWRRVVGCVLGVVALRGGISTQEIQRTFAPSLEAWEIELLLRWGTRMGAVEELATPRGERSGWQVVSWWWLLAGSV